MTAPRPPTARTPPGLHDRRRTGTGTGTGQRGTAARRTGSGTGQRPAPGPRPPPSRPRHGPSPRHARAARETGRPRPVVRPVTAPEETTAGAPCPACGTPNPPGRRFCRRCAAPLTPTTVRAPLPWWRTVWPLRHGVRAAPGGRCGSW
ncbi:zinc ribbon domain-containing protein [Streptomyces sp. M19]